MGILGSLFGRKDSAVGSLISMRRIGKPVWSERNFKAFAKEGYTQNVIAYRAIRLIAENVASIQPLIYEGRRELSEHPFLTVLNRPNPWQGRADLIDAFTAFGRIAGNAYLEAVELDGDIRELYTLRPDRMKAIAGRRGYPQAWQYCIDGEAKATFAMDVGPTVQTPILHFKEFHPTDDWYGLSPMEAAAFSVDVHNAAGGYNKALLDNSAAPSGALVVKGGDGKDNQLTDDQFTRLKREMDEKMSGARNAGKPLLLEGGLEWQAMGFSPKDLEFTSGKREAAREIALAFGVPPMLLGIPGDNTYSNYKEANRALWRQTILPLADRIFGAIGNWVQPTYAGIRIGYDLDQIEALSSEREEAWKRVENADFITTDEKREAVGYGPYKPNADQPGGQILVGGGMVPLDEAGFMPGGPEPAEDDEDAEPAPAAAEE
jgi:HK97 family phage portal protein